MIMYSDRCIYHIGIFELVLHNIILRSMIQYVNVS